MKVNIMLVTLCLLMASCSSFNVFKETRSATRKMASKSGVIKGENISTFGASNTTGFGASLSLKHRIQKHWSTDHEKIIDLLESKTVALSIDYFFPTNFPQIDNPKYNHKKKVKEILLNWSKSHDIVIVSKLPVMSDSTDEALMSEFLDNSSKADSLKTIMEALSNEQTAVGTRAVNAAIDEMAKQEANVFIVPIMNMFEMFQKEYFETNFITRGLPKVSKLFSDQLHLNDKGQAFFYNNLIIPALSKAFNIRESQIPLMSMKKLSSRDVSKVMSLTTCSKSDALERRDCTYWAQPMSEEDFSSQSASLYIPQGYINEVEQTNWLASEKRTVKNMIEKIKDPVKKRRVVELMGLSEIIEDKASGEGFQLSIENNDNKLSLDLSKVLFYGQFPAFKTSDDSFENWGYDHWLSYRYLYNGDFVLEKRLRRASMPAPGTNYFIRVDRDKEDPAKMIMTWRVYMTIDGQKDDQMRLDHIPAPHLQAIKKNEYKYPYLEYKIKLEVKDL